MAVINRTNQPILQSINRPSNQRFQFTLPKFQFKLNYFTLGLRLAASLVIPPNRMLPVMVSEVFLSQSSNIYKYYIAFKNIDSPTQVSLNDITSALHDQFNTLSDDLQLIPIALVNLLSRSNDYDPVSRLETFFIAALLLLAMTKCILKK